MCEIIALLVGWGDVVSVVGARKYLNSGGLGGYAVYKDSGVEWLGEIPGHWEVKPIKWMATMQSGESTSELKLLSKEEDPYKFPVVGGNGIIGYTSMFNTIGTYIVIGRVGALCGNIHTFSSEAWITDNALIFKVNKNSALHLSYTSYVLKSRNLNDLADKTAQPLLTGGKIKNEILPLPPLAEQRAIAAFLDRETEHIDTLIAKKEQFIRLQQEKRSALISHAVTRGLSECVARGDAEFGAWAKPVKCKDSGVEWLGEIPEHWEVKRLHHLTKIVRGASPRPAGSELYFGGDHTPWITVAELTKNNDKYLHDVHDFLTEEGRKQSRVIPIGTLLLSNSGATLGVPKITLIEGCINDGSVAFFNLNNNALKDYIFYFLKNSTTTLREYMQGSGQPNLNTTIVGGIQIPLPPLAEQHAIAAYLDRETTRTDAILQKTKHSIALLKEKRSALISAAVTGQIKTPEAA